MTDTFLDRESAREPDDAVEIYAITTSVGRAWYLTSAIRDISFGGRLYKATAIDRGELGVDSISDAREMEIRIAIDHPLVSRWTTYGVPPKRTTVVVTRVYADGTSEEQWEGDVTSLAWDDDQIAKFRVPARMTDALERRIPNISCSTTCTHILYDGNCGISKTGASPGGVNHQVIVNATTVNGREVTATLAAGTERNGTWSEGGTLTHFATGETMTIGRQTDIAPGVSGVSRMTMQARIAEMKTGDAVIIQRGCKHTIEDCRDSFNNVAKFSGYPELPEANPFKTGKIL